MQFATSPERPVNLPAATDESIVLILGTNEQYTMPLAVTLFSTLANLKSRQPVRIFILNTGLSAKAKDHITRVLTRKQRDVDLIFTSVDPKHLSSYSSKGHLTVDSALRLLAPECLPPDIEKVLWLDCDLLVLKDITPLWQFDVSQFQACAAIDSIIRVVSNESGLNNYRELGLAAKSPYFNAGVLLMNLRAWREEQIGRTCLQYMKHHECRFLDQDAINAVLAGRIGELPMTWNAIVNHLKYYWRWPDDELKRAIAPDIEALRHSPAICHFAGGAKPWRPGFQVPFIGRWIYYLWRSRWFSFWEVTRWTARFSVLHVSIIFRRKVIAPIFGSRAKN